MIIYSNISSDVWVYWFVHVHVHTTTHAYGIPFCSTISLIATILPSNSVLQFQFPFVWLCVNVCRSMCFFVRAYIIHYCLYNFAHESMLTWLFLLLERENKKETMSNTEFYLDALKTRIKPHTHTKKCKRKTKLPTTWNSLLSSAKIVIYNQSEVSLAHTHTPCSVIELCYRCSTLYLHRVQYLPITLPLPHSLSIQPPLVISRSLQLFISIDIRYMFHKHKVYIYVRRTLCGNAFRFTYSHIISDSFLSFFGKKEHIDYLPNNILDWMWPEAGAQMKLN